MRRRTFVSGLALVAAAPVLARASPKTYLLGVLAPGDVTSWPRSPLRLVTVAKLAEYGFREGDNLKIEPRYGNSARLEELARELVALKPNVILAVSRPAIVAARRATAETPIVMSFIGEDPVGLGLVQSNARPAGNVTGVVMLAPELEAKRLDLLLEALPGARRIAVLLTDRLEEDQKRAQLETLGRHRGAELRFFPVGGPSEYPTAFEQMQAFRAQALVVMSGPELFRDASQIADLAIRAKLLTVCEWREMARAGCLLGYGPSLVELRHRTADYVARIFQGAAPGELPIEGPTRFEFAVNARTAEKLGVDLATSVLLRADEVIE